MGETQTSLGNFVRVACGRREEQGEFGGTLQILWDEGYWAYCG